MPKELDPKRQQLKEKAIEFRNAFKTYNDMSEDEKNSPSGVKYKNNILKMAKDYYKLAGLSDDIIALIDPANPSLQKAEQFKEEVVALIEKSRQTITELQSDLRWLYSIESPTIDQKRTMAEKSNLLSKTQEELNVLLFAATQMAGDSVRKKDAVVVTSSIVGKLAGTLGALIWTGSCMAAWGSAGALLAGFGSIPGAIIGLMQGTPGAIRIADYSATAGEYARNNQLQGSMVKVLDNLIDLSADQKQPKPHGVLPGFEGNKGSKQKGNQVTHHIDDHSNGAGKNKRGPRWS